MSDAREREAPPAAPDAVARVLDIVALDAARPLTVLALQVEVLKRARNAEERARALQAVERSVAELKGMLEDVRDVALLESGALRMLPHTIDLAGLVHGAVARARDEATRRGVTVEASAPPTLRANLDAGRIARVLSTLVSIAVAASPRGGLVHVSLLEEDASARVVVAHDGRVAPTAALGLAQKLVEAHGGRMRPPEHSTRGTRLQFVVPTRLR